MFARPVNNQMLQLFCNYVTTFPAKHLQYSFFCPLTEIPKYKQVPNLNGLLTAISLDEVESFLPRPLHLTKHFQHPVQQHLKGED